MTTEALKKAHDRRRELKEAGVEIVRLDPMQKAAKNPKSLRLAINAKCAQCVCWHGDPNPRQRIRDCGVFACALFPLRPYQAGGQDDDASDETQEAACATS